ncbi:hypothetical protein DOU15_13920 [Clavibacter michiganensis subsp. michiganensis]|nr:hypothetical protein [Clavibacter michiganensis subsp. michiganensis]
MGLGGVAQGTQSREGNEWSNRPSCTPASGSSHDAAAVIQRAVEAWSWRAAEAASRAAAMTRHAADARRCAGMGSGRSIRLMAQQYRIRRLRG